MNETEIAVKLAEHSKEIGSLKHRAAELEEENKAIQALAISVKELAVNMKNMMTELQKQGARLEALEKVPIETNKQVKAAIITALIGGVIGAVVTAVFTMIGGF